MASSTSTETSSKPNNFPRLLPTPLSLRSPRQSSSLADPMLMQEPAQAWDAVDATTNLFSISYPLHQTQTSTITTILRQGKEGRTNITPVIGINAIKHQLRFSDRDRASNAC